VTVTIVSDDPARGWRAAATHKWLNSPCTTASGADAVGVESGAIVCGTLAVPSSSATQND
jgi:hypothetical protein